MRLLAVDKLASLEPLPKNELTKNRLEEIEQMKVGARPMELESIAKALGLPPAWFEIEDWRALISAEAAAEASPEVQAMIVERSVLQTTLLMARKELERLQKLLPPDERGAAVDRS